MNSIIHAIYYHRYRPKTMDPAIASECAEMFDVGFAWARESCWKS